jgi:hypothetical protein
MRWRGFSAVCRRPRGQNGQGRPILGRGTCWAIRGNHRRRGGAARWRPWEPSALAAEGLSAGSLREPPRRISRAGAARCGRQVGTRWRGAERSGGAGDAPWGGRAAPARSAPFCLRGSRRFPRPRSSRANLHPRRKVCAHAVPTWHKEGKGNARQKARWGGRPARLRADPFGASWDSCDGTHGLWGPRRFLSG